MMKISAHRIIFLEQEKNRKFQLIFDRKNDFKMFGGFVDHFGR